MANLVDKINEKHMRKDIPEFRVGDTVRVDVWVKEGKKERIRADKIIEDFAAENGIELAESVDAWSKEQNEACPQSFFQSNQRNRID